MPDPLKRKREGAGRVELTGDEAQLVAQLLRGVVNEYYPTDWYDWPKVAALRDRLRAQGVDLGHDGIGFDDDYPAQGHP
jgi:hypothetical protein